MLALEDRHPTPDAYRRTAALLSDELDSRQETCGALLWRRPFRSPDLASAAVVTEFPTANMQEASAAARMEDGRFFDESHATAKPTVCSTHPLRYTAGMHIIAAGALVFTAGIFFGIFGAGGSILLVPILVYVLDLPVKMALGMSLLILVLTGGIATLAHARSRNVSWRIGLRWAAFGIVGAYIGGRVAEFVPEAVLLMIFAIVVVVASAAMMRRRGPEQARTPVTHINLPKVITVGLLLGFFTGMIGVGGGFLIVPAMVLVCGLDVKLAIGTSLLVITINSLGGFIGFAAHETFPAGLTATVAAFTAAGGLIGERLGKPLPARRLRPAFGVFLLIVGAAMAVQNLIEMFGAR